MDIQRCCLFEQVAAKISKLKKVYATKNTSMHFRASERLTLDIGTVGGQIKLGHLKFNLCKSDH
jgi:hypothetical protein